MYLRHLCATFFCLVSLLFAVFASAQEAGKEEPKPAETPAEVLFKFSFENDVQRWQGVGTKAVVEHTTEEANVHGGKGALKFGYRIQAKEISGAIVPLRDKALAKMKSLRFWLKPDHATVLAVIFEERNGGRYIAFLSLLADKWQEILLAPEDFLLSQNDGDPKDPNGKLDLEEVGSIGLADYSQWLTRQEGEQVEKLFPYRRGEHVMYLDDMVASTAPLPETTQKQDNALIFDTFVRPQPFWTPMGKVALSIADGKPLMGKSLKLDYQHSPDSYVVVGRTFSKSPFPKMSRFAFNIASEKPMRLVVQLEEKRGGKYYVTLNMVGDRETREFVLNFNEFQPSPDSRDTNKQLDLDQIQRIYFLDITGIQDKVTQPNSLWLNNLRVLLP